MRREIEPYCRDASVRRLLGEASRVGEICTVKAIEASGEDALTARCETAYSRCL